MIEIRMPVKNRGTRCNTAKFIAGVEWDERQTNG